MVQKRNNKYIKSPLNYMGGKYQILSDIIPHFPDGIDTFVDLFAGGFNVGINVEAKTIVCNDHISYVIDMLKFFRDTEGGNLLNQIYDRVKAYDLSKTNDKGYLSLREEYNRSRQSIDLFMLTCYSFNHQIRFNSKHEFNTPFGKERSSYNKNIEANLISFVGALKNKFIRFENRDFTQLDFTRLGENDFIYCDPPYLITTGSYNDGKRGFKDWTEKEECELLTLLDFLHKQKVKFALSNVLQHKGNTNNMLLDWSKKYVVNFIEKEYSNCNYQFKEKNAITVEVLITNYDRGITKWEQMKLL